MGFDFTYNIVQGVNETGRQWRLGIFTGISSSKLCYLARDEDDWEGETLRFEGNTPRKEKPLFNQYLVYDFALFVNRIE